MFEVLDAFESFLQQRFYICGSWTRKEETLQ